MNKFRKLLVAAMLLASVTLVGQASESMASDLKVSDKMVDERADSELVSMFKWLNKVYVSDEDFTEEGFAQFFTNDILFVVNGQKRERGIQALTKRYNNLKSRYAYIEILFPFQEEERVGNKIYTYYINRGWEDDANPIEITTHVMGYVEIKDNKISVLNFLFADLEPET